MNTKIDDKKLIAWLDDVRNDMAELRERIDKKRLWEVKNTAIEGNGDFWFQMELLQDEYHDLEKALIVLRARFASTEGY
jgi:hypothetical protein